MVWKLDLFSSSGGGKETLSWDPQKELSLITGHSMSYNNSCNGPNRAQLLLPSSGEGNRPGF
jgi:hypothetical protein